MGSETSAGGGGPVTRLAVLLFSDIVASTELKTKFGDVEYKRLLDRHNELFESSLGQISGARIIKHTGDGFLAELRTPSDAVRFALLFHSRMHLEPWQPVKLQTRIGIHQGEFTATIHAGQADVVGAAVDAAARIMSLAVGGQILLTQHVFNDARQFVRESPQALPGSPPLRWLSHGPYLFRGIDEPIRVCEVGIEGISPLSPPTSDKAKRVVPHDEEQTLGWRPAVGLDVPGRVSWKLESKLGEGGFGEVWLGQHEKLKERRVFKFCFDADRLRSLKREYTLFRLLREALGDREDIARLYEVKLDKPPFFLESEYTQGGNLLEWAARKRGIAAVPLAQRLDIVARICEAAGAAHSVGVLHKDIKPSNILIHEEANGAVLPRLSDFGIGMLGDRDSLRAHAITETGFTQLTQNSDSSRTGTRMYAPPESLLNRPFTTQGDVYALGVLLFQMAVADLGRPLAPGWERDIDDAVLRQDISKAVDGDPNQRLASAAELAGRVRTLDDRRQARVAQMQQAARALARARTRRLAGIAAVGILFIAIISIAAFLRERRQADEQAHLRALAESLQQSESAQHQHAQANLLRARKEIADMVAILEGKRASTDAATQPTTGVNPAGSPEDRPMSLRLADSIVANYLLFQKESADPEITESLAQAYISKAGIYFGTYTAKIEEHLQWSNEALTAANAGCIVLRRLIESDPARHDKYCGELADGLTEIAQFASDQNELERAYSEAVELRDDLAKSGKPADAIALVDLLVKGVRTDQEKTVAQKRLNHAIDLLRAIGATSESSEQRGRLALALARLAEINTDDSAARIGYLRSAADALMPAKAPMKFSDEELEMARLAITLQRDLAEALAAANQRVEALNCAARAAGIGDAIIKDHADWARSLILELASVQTSLAVLHATGNDPASAEPYYQRATDTLSSVGGWDSSQEENRAAHDAVEAQTIYLLNQAQAPRALALAARFSIGMQYLRSNDAVRTAVTLAAIYRSASLAHLVKNLPQQQRAETEAQNLLTEFVREQPKGAWKAVPLMARLDVNATSDEARAYRAAQVNYAVSVLTVATRAGKAPPEESECRQPATLAVLLTSTDFPKLQSEWEQRKRAATTQRLATTQLAANDIEQIDLAARTRTVVTVSGHVQSARWTANGGSLLITLRDTPSDRFVFYTTAGLRVELEAKLGGRLEDVLPGAELVLRGVPVFYRDTLEIKISNASQIVNFVPAPSASATAPSSKFAQTVRGRVKLARWSASRKTLYLELEGGSELPVITIFQNEAAVIAAAMANGGELDEFFRGRSIEVRGNLEDYPVGWNTKYVGRKQIIVLEVSQIRVMSDQPATAASK